MIALLVQQALDAPADAVKSTAVARMHLFGDYYLGDPYFLLLAPLALIVLLYGRAARASGRVPTLPQAALPRSLAQRFAWVAFALQGCALVLVAICLARPVRADVEQTTTSEGIDIVLAVDRSSSMKYQDLEESKNRLEVVKEVVADFAVRRMTDRVGAADNVALVTFAQYPQLLCPFTLDVGALTGFVKGIEMVRHEAEDGTAIGRGLAKSVQLLKDSDAKSRVVVLLTDGENNVDDITPQEAAKLAAEIGVRVYTVMAGRYVYQEDIFGRVYATERQLDSTDLEEIAKTSGGRFFRARDRDALERVYSEIETLERTERSEQRFTETYDLYTRWLLSAIALYVLAWLSHATWARRLP